MDQITIPIRGMSSAGCQRSVGQALRRLPGVHAATVTLGSATLLYDPAVVDHLDLVDTIANAGYAASAV